MYGGTTWATCRSWRGRGLSPRVRGNRVDVDTVSRFEGSIPACTGEPHLNVPTHVSAKVYPRVYGGTISSHHRVTNSMGLSPRVRGNHLARVLADPGLGSIPACTGEPLALKNRNGRCWVYPRVYGGTIIEVLVAGASDGLSPRVRGNLFTLQGDRVDVGSIPACTGEPRTSNRTSPHGPVYPRVYGGTGLGVLIFVGGVGLSPRVRGNRQREVWRMV